MRQVWLLVMQLLIPIGSIGGIYVGQEIPHAFLSIFLSSNLSALLVLGAFWQKDCPWTMRVLQLQAIGSGGQLICGLLLDYGAEWLPPEPATLGFLVAMGWHAVRSLQWIFKEVKIQTD